MTITVGYSLSACIDLANNGGLLSASSLADKAGISAAYMGQVLNKLRTDGIVTSTGGVAGGYRLSRAARQIQVGQIIESIMGPPRDIPQSIPPKIRRQLKRANRELHAIRLSDL